MIYLRPPTQVDIDLMYLWRNHESVRRYSRRSEPFSLKEHMAWVRGLENRPEIDIKMLIEEGRDRIGVGRLDLDAPRQTAEFSLYLGPEQHGKGRGVPAMRALMTYAFENHPWVTLLWGETHRENRAAQRTFEKAGLIRSEGPAQWLRFAIERGQWETLTAG